MVYGGFKVCQPLCLFFLINKIFANRNKDNISILDVGSAPGGKAFQLLDLGFKVKSIEISKEELRFLNQILKD